MTEKKHFNLGPANWDCDALLYQDPEDGGLALKNIMHSGYQLASDIRVTSIWVGSKDGTLKQYYLGSAELPSVTSIQHNKQPQTKLFAPYPQLLDLSAEFKTKGPVLGKDKDSQPLSITQRYIFTNYSNTPSHEPAGTLTAARLYPLLKFSYKSAPKEPKPPTYIRVDYRIEVTIEMGLAIQHSHTTVPIHSSNPDITKGRQIYGLKAPTSMKTTQFQQAAVFKDIDVQPSAFWTGVKVAGDYVLPGKGSRLTDVFSALEKPLPNEMIGWGIKNGETADWDNIHIWGYNANAATGFLPATPGMNHGFHLHWRWGKLAAKKTGFPFYGMGEPQFSPHGAGIPFMIETNTTSRRGNLRFAITGDVKKQNSGPWRATDHSSTKNFENQFTGSAPGNILKGAPLVLWMSMEISRSDEPMKIFSGAGIDWEGTFFLNGIYFPHNPEVIPEDLVPLSLAASESKPGTRSGPLGWYRP